MAIKASYMEKSQYKGIVYNLYHMWQAVGNKPGWTIHENSELLLLKSPATVPHVNLVMVTTSTQVNNKSQLLVQDFFENKNFGIFGEAGKTIELKLPLKYSLQFREMVTSTDKVTCQEITPKIDFVQNEQQLKEWCKVAGTLFEYEPERMLPFKAEIYLLEGTKLLYFSENDKIVGTAHVHVDDNNFAYIVSLGVLEEWRGKGIGSQLMNACINFSKEKGAKTLALDSTTMGESLYKKWGFATGAKWYFSVY
jgi:N-acetylglutamate synthase-like GNAT family acetyltransferase